MSKKEQNGNATLESTQEHSGRVSFVSTFNMLRSTFKTVTKGPNTKSHHTKRKNLATLCNNNFCTSLDEIDREPSSVCAFSRLRRDFPGDESYVFASAEDQNGDIDTGSDYEIATEEDLEFTAENRNAIDERKKLMSQMKSIQVLGVEASHAIRALYQVSN
ncbi:hypothetical protein AX16_007177 [Volvariella volvacea WC 439]|nr:hypothetical protein AX16_007177 [Volvariella volvacea WC 439]